MEIAVDIGNTNINIAVFEENQFVKQLRLPSNSQSNLADYEALIQNYFRNEKIESQHAIKRICVSSVVPSLTEKIVSVLEKLSRKKCIILSKDHADKIPLKIPSDEMGSDLIADALEAYHRAQGSCIVVDFGTALSFTAVLQSGEVCGVAIAPGLETAVKSLFKNTAQLPEVPIALPEKALGTTTIGAIQSGVVLGYKGLIESLLAQMKSEMKAKQGDVKITVFATGGLSFVMKNTNDIFDFVDNHLTLYGINRFAELVEMN